MSPSPKDVRYGSPGGDAETPINSTFGSRRRARLAREAVEGVPPRRQLGLAAGDRAESIFVIEDADEGGSAT